MNVFLSNEDTIIYDEKKIILRSMDDIHHIKNVMRKKKDDIIFVNTLDEKKIEAKILSMEKEEIVFEILEVLERTNESNINVTIYQAIAKSDRLEYFLEKATELGIYEFCLTNFSRNVVRVENEKKLEKKLQRWEKIVEAASRQSRRNRIPEIRYINNIEKEDYAKYDLVYILYENEENRKLQDILKSDLEKIVLQNTKEKKMNIAIVVGPEGGIDKKEIEFLKGLPNSTSILIGPRILRTETAGIAFLSILQFVYGDF